MAKSKSLLKLSLAGIGILYTINKIIDFNASKNRSVRTGGSYYQWTHGAVYYRVYGEGKPLLLIHDLDPMSSGSEWAELIRPLANDYKVYTLDLPGCGKSEKPGITYTNYFYVQMISDFVHNVIKEKTAVAATGLSSSFVLMANTMYPDLFSSLAMINPPSFASLAQGTNTSAKIARFVFEIPVIGKTVYYIATNRPNTENTLTEKAYYNPFKLTPSTTKAYYDAAHTGTGNGKYLMGCLAGHYLNIDCKAALHKADIPLMLISGDHCPHQEEIAASYQSINPEISIKTVKNAKLLPQLEEPEQMLAYLKEL